MIYRKQLFRNAKTLEHRKKARSVYESKAGQDELFNWFHDLGLFRVIGEDELGARNKAIKKAEELGLLDEQNIRFLLACFFEMPLDEIERRRFDIGEAMNKAQGYTDLIGVDGGDK